MTTHSFATAKTISFNVVSNHTDKFDKPFDDKMDFNRVIKDNKDDPYGTIYSIDAVKMLRVVSSDKLSRLAKITLATRADRNGGAGVAMWDVFFNMVGHHALMGCIMLANSEYAPIPQSRVINNSSFLDYSRPVSRVHFNKVLVGDVVGIGLYDAQTNLTYVLLYSVQGTCVVNKENPNTEIGTVTIPGINCLLTQVLRFKANGEAAIVSMTDEDYDSDKATPFVEWIFNNTNEITDAYPWKPHLLPIIPPAYDRSEIEAAFTEVEKTAYVGRYEDFDFMCRRAYAVARAQPRPAPEPRPVGKNGKRKFVPRAPNLPIVEIYSVGEYIYGICDVNNNGDCEVVKFAKSTLGYVSVLEHYLSGNDLIDCDVAEVSSVMMLDKGDSGDELNFYRKLSINY